MAKLDTDILDSLDDLGYTGWNVKDSDALLSCVDRGVESSEFTDVVAWMSSELRLIYGLEEQVHPIKDQKDAGSFILELTSFLKELECPYASLTSCPSSERLSRREQKLQVLDFMCTELQAARLSAVNQAKVPDDCSAMKNMKIESETAGILKSMLVTLGFPKPPENITSAQLFTKATQKVSEELNNVPKKRLGKPLFTGVLSEKQWGTLEALDRDMKMEYRTRSDLLLKRLDVTVQSFSWSDRVKKMESDLVKIYRPRRQILAAESSIGISDLLAARDDLTLMEKTSGSKVRKNTQSKINKVMMRGRMPDRGGRPTEIEPPPPEMPPWQKDRAPQPQRGGGRGRGGGGGFQQRGGGGGGGGRGQGGGGGYNQGQSQSWGGDSRYTNQQQNFGQTSFQPQYQGGHQQQAYGNSYGGGAGAGNYQQGGYQQGGGYQQQGGYQGGHQEYSSQRGRGRGRRW